MNISSMCYALFCHRHYYESINGGELACIDEQIPFDIPDSWEWVRCSALGAIVRGSGIKRSDIVADGAPCVRYGELYTSYETTFTEALSHIPENLFDKCKIFSKGAVLFTLTGENKPDIGKALAYLGEQPIAAGGDLAFWEYHGLNPEFLVYSLNSPYAVGEKIKRATGDIIVHISGDKIGSILIGVPPLYEQQKIVEKIHELQPILSDYGITSSLLAKLDSGFPSSLKKSILQHAIQGKLVPQDPNDEPASVLLERIAEERAKLGKKAAKSMSRIERRDRGTYEIFPDGSEKDISGEIPFDIPESWAWCRLGSIMSVSSGKSLPLNIKSGIGEYPVYGGNGIMGKYSSFNVAPQTLIIGRVGALCGNTHLTEKTAWVTDNALICEFSNKLIINTFLKIIIDGLDLRKKSSATAQPVITGKIIYPSLIAIAPVNEQHRIVEKLGVLMKELGVTK